MVPVIKVKGFRCFVEEAVYTDRKDAVVQVLSLTGSREAVKAVWARLLKGEAAYLEESAGTRILRFNVLGKGKLFTERLPSGAFHGLLLATAVLQGQILVCEREAELPERFYKLLCNQLRLPLHSLWADWLWDHALREELVTKLSSRRLYAYELEVDAHALEQAVRTALVEGELPTLELEVQRAA